MNDKRGTGVIRTFHYLPGSTGKIGGFSLMEVMVSFMVLAVGLLGMAALQGNSLRYSMQAYFQTQSVILNYDIFDRMRANPAGVAGGSYTPDTMPASFTLDCDSTMCTPSQLATYDLVEWKSGTSLRTCREVLQL